MRIVCLELHFGVFWCVIFVLCIGTGVEAATSSAAVAGQQIRHKIQDECQFTRYPSLCVKTLLGLGSGSYQYTDVISALVNETLAESNLPASTAGFSTLSSQLGPKAAQISQSVSGDKKIALNNKKVG